MIFLDMKAFELFAALSGNSRNYRNLILSFILFDLFSGNLPQLLHSDPDFQSVLGCSPGGMSQLVFLHLGFQHLFLKYVRDSDFCPSA